MSIEFDDEFSERIVSTDATPADDGEFSLRPKSMEEYIGQSKAKENLAVFIEAAKRGRTARPCLAVWSAGSWQDDTGEHHCQ